MVYCVPVSCCAMTQKGGWRTIVVACFRHWGMLETCCHSRGALGLGWGIYINTTFFFFHFKSIKSRTQLYPNNNEINQQQLNISHRTFTQNHNLRVLVTEKKKKSSNEHSKPRFVTAFKEPYILQKVCILPTQLHRR